MKNLKKKLLIAALLVAFIVIPFGENVSTDLDAAICVAPLMVCHGECCFTFWNWYCFAGPCDVIF